MTFEGSDASTILVALVQFGCVEQPGLDGLVVGGGEDEVAGHQNPLERKQFYLDFSISFAKGNFVLNNFPI